MALFNKKKTEEAKKETAKAPAAEKKGPSIHNVKVPAAKAETKPAPAKAPAPKAAPAASKVVAKPAPAKAAAPAAKAPAAKAPATKPATPAKKTVPASQVPEGITVVPRPFFMKPEEDVKLAFDQAIAEAEAEIAKNGAKAVGKYEFELEVDGFHFYLVANSADYVLMVEDNTIRRMRTRKFRKMVYNKKVKKAIYLKKAADCTAAAVYYKLCKVNNCYL